LSVRNISSQVRKTTNLECTKGNHSSDDDDDDDDDGDRDDEEPLFSQLWAQQPVPIDSLTTAKEPPVGHCQWAIKKCVAKSALKYFFNEPLPFQQPLNNLATRNQSHCISGWDGLGWSSMGCA